MMNKAVLVGSPPLQEELLRPRRRQQPRQRPRPWEGTSLFFSHWRKWLHQHQQHVPREKYHPKESIRPWSCFHVLSLSTLSGKISPQLCNDAAV